MTAFQQGQCPPPAGQEAATRVDQPDACGTTPTKVALKPAVQAFRDVGAGITPAGPGARSLIDAFTHIDTEFKEAARIDAKVVPQFQGVRCAGGVDGERGEPEAVISSSPRRGAGQAPPRDGRESNAVPCSWLKSTTSLR
ncbi:hypothetical protein [Streptomyces sp. NPDC026589]|uniref:hypothetical protein n=1 Tax=Streptomyces sp. NPDC026589 TaxID=3155609 RepID=UPI0033C252C9